MITIMMFKKQHVKSPRMRIMKSKLTDTPIHIADNNRRTDTQTYALGYDRHTDAAIVLLPIQRRIHTHWIMTDASTHTHTHTHTDRGPTGAGDRWVLREIGLPPAHVPSQ